MFPGHFHCHMAWDRPDWALLADATGSSLAAEIAAGLPWSHASPQPGTPAGPARELAAKRQCFHDLLHPTVDDLFTRRCPQLKKWREKLVDDWQRQYSVVTYTGRVIVSYDQATSLFTQTPSCRDLVLSWLQGSLNDFFDAIGANLQRDVSSLHCAWQWQHRIMAISTEPIEDLPTGLFDGVPAAIARQCHVKLHAASSFGTHRL